MSSSSPDVIDLPLLELRNLSARFPFEHLGHFIQDLNLKVIKGQNIVISGPSGSGKSSLFRCLASIWPLTNGRAYWDPSINPLKPNHVMWLPQVPYFTNGYLIEQVLLPRSIEDCQVNDVIRDKVLKILYLLDLGHLIDRYGVQGSTLMDWSNVLSPGEQQRISFARLIFNNPIVAFVDEATSQVSNEMQQKMYEHIQTMGITVVSIAHRHSLKPFHRYNLHINGNNGTWTLSDSNII